MAIYRQSYVNEQLVIMKQSAWPARLGVTSSSSSQGYGAHSNLASE